MEHEDSVLRSLETRLSDLEQRVQNYRLELVDQFQQYFDSIVVSDINNSQMAPEIASSITATFHLYPTLRPTLRQPRPGDSILPISRDSPHPAPAIAHARQPHEAARDRDNELRGIFTPSFLPLFDGTGEPPASPTPAAGADASKATPQPKTIALNGSHAAPADGHLTASGSTASSQADGQTQYSAPAAMAGRDLPRLQTGDDELSPNDVPDDANSSVSSEKSDAPARRSAMRRSSSTSKAPQSPRRVRFEVMGTEVLPTASPQRKTYISARPSSPAPGGSETPSSDSILGDDVDFDPPPRKISSSDALRALSRTPLEEGTVWTVVNADNEDGSEQDSSGTTTPRTTTPDKKPSYEPARFYTNTDSGELGLSGDVLQNAQDQLSNESSDDEALSLGRKVKMPTQLPASPADRAGKAGKAGKLPIRPNSSEIQKQSAASNPAPKSSPKASRPANDDDHDDHDDHDDMFDFETEPGMRPARKASAPVPAADETHDLDEDVDHIRPSRTTASALSSSLTQSLSIQRRAASRQDTSPSAGKFTVGSIGSYKGKPVMMPVVKDPALHARAASLANASAIIGSLEDGLDNGDINSYRASLASGAYAGTPRSFTERMLMEDIQEEKRQQQRKRG